MTGQDRKCLIVKTEQQVRAWLANVHHSPRLVSLIMKDHALFFTAQMVDLSVTPLFRPPRMPQASCSFTGGSWYSLVFLLARLQSEPAKHAKAPKYPNEARHKNLRFTRVGPFTSMGFSLLCDPFTHNIVPFTTTWGLFTQVPAPGRGFGGGLRRL